MKHLLLFLILWFLSGISVEAQSPGNYKVHLPIIEVFNPCIGGGVSDWKIVVPEPTINKALNPSAENTGNFAAGGGATVTRSTTYQKYGLYSFRVQTAGNNEGLDLTLGVLANAIHYVTLRVRGTLPAVWDWSLDNATYSEPALLKQTDSNWALYGLQFPAAQANASTTLYIDQNGAGSGDFYIDGVQAEEKEYWTTYCDGTQDGCAWLGAAHAATSERSAQSRAGGRVQDLQDDYNLNVGGISGAGTAPVNISIDEYAILPGGEVNSIDISSGVMTLSGLITGATLAEFHSKRDVLARVLDPSAFPGQQPVRLRYEGATIHKEIAVQYEGGLDVNIQASEPCFWEKVNIRFLVPNPYWLEIGESAISLDTNDSATFRAIAARLRSTGQWDELGPPNAAGTYTFVSAIAEDNTYIYVGGDFLNFDNIANADYIARWHKVNQTWSALGTGMNGIVDALLVGPDGTLFIGGRYTTAGGGAANRIVAWDPSTETFSALGTGMNGDVYALAIGLDGTLYAVGAFTTADGGGANRIAEWDGAAWAALGSGLNNDVYSITIGLNGTLVYVGGIFTTAGGGGANQIASWNTGTSVWAALGSGVNNTLYNLVVSRVGILYAAGAFTTAGGVTVNYVAAWNPSSESWSALGSGMNTWVYKLAIGPDDMLYATGIFTTAGGLTTANRLARWNQYVWAHLDIILPGSATVTWALASEFTDPVIEQNYDLFLGFNTSGTGNFAGLVTPNNEGSVQAFPKIIYARNGGTSAIIETLRNETTGKELLFDYPLLDGETLTINLEPTQKSIISSFFGSRLDAVLPNSDFGTWALPRGNSDVTSFIAVAGGSTITAYMQWRDAYSGYD